MSADPLVITLQLDATTQERFDAERRALFPPGRTQVGAHVTLFHALPGEHLDAVSSELAVVASRAALAVTVTGIRSLGRGAAYTLECAELTQLRNCLAAAWTPWLTPQDRQGFRAHVTVQNKVDVATARETVAALTATFSPFAARGIGLQLWRYVGGPWEHVQLFPFSRPRRPA